MTSSLWLRWSESAKKVFMKERRVKVLYESKLEIQPLLLPSIETRGRLAKRCPTPQGIGYYNGKGKKANTTVHCSRRFFKLLTTTK